MEDYKVAIYEYLSNHWSLLSQILSLDLNDQAKLSYSSNILNEDDIRWKMTSNGRQPKIAKFEYLSNHWSNHSKIVNLGLNDTANLHYVQIIFQMKMTLNG